MYTIEQGLGYKINHCTGFFLAVLDAISHHISQLYFLFIALPAMG
jgi:hypothetical protein